jgi:hypothetical protein
MEFEEEGEGEEEEEEEEEGGDDDGIVFIAAVVVVVVVDVEVFNSVDRGRCGALSDFHIDKHPRI